MLSVVNQRLILTEVVDPERAQPFWLLKNPLEISLMFQAIKA